MKIIAPRILLVAILLFTGSFLSLSAQVNETFIGKKGKDYTLVELQLPISNNIPTKLNKHLAGQLFGTKDSTIRESYDAYQKQFEKRTNNTSHIPKNAHDIHHFQLTWLSIDESRYACVLLEVYKTYNSGKKKHKKQRVVLWNMKKNKRLKTEDVFKLTTLSDFTQQYGGTRYEPCIKKEGVVHLRFTKDNKIMEAEFNPTTHPQYFQPSFLELMGIAVPEGDKTTELATDPNDNNIYDLVDVLPQFKGGTREMQLYLARNLQYPAKAMKAGKEGRVYVSFIVDKQGKLQDIQVAKQVSPELDAEALRLVRNMPEWEPGIIGGKTVLTRMTLPIKFVMNNKQQEEAKPAVAEAPKTETAPAATSADKTFVVIIANEHYQEEQPVAYALNDGEAFRKCCIEVMGIPKENVHIRKDATLNHMRHELQWLKDVAAAYQGEAHIIVYYAGHGMPDESTHSSYLLPVDGIASSVITGYSMDNFYQQLAQLNVKDVLVFLDACFSGANRGKGMLTSSRGVALKPKSTIPDGKLIVYAATQGNETAYPFHDMRHGLFTYYLLDKINNSNGALSLGELQEYVSTEVLRKSVVINRKRQTPSINTSTGIGSTWKNLRLK